MKLGIDAPKSVAVNREEVYRAKKRIEQIIDEKEAVPGKIKTFDIKRGMGFASLRELNQDIFIHYKFFKKREDSNKVSLDDALTFKLQKTRHGLSGYDVELDKKVTLNR